MKNIGVEKGLGTVKDYLSNNGYKVQEIDTQMKSGSSLSNFDALVVTGLDDNFMGIDDTSTKVPIFKAEGLSPEDVKKMLDNNITK